MVPCLAFTPAIPRWMPFGRFPPSLHCPHQMGCPRWRAAPAGGMPATPLAPARRRSTTTPPPPPPPEPDAAPAAGTALALPKKNGGNPAPDRRAGHCAADHCFSDVPTPCVGWSLPRQICVWVEGPALPKGQSGSQMGGGQEKCGETQLLDIWGDILRMESTFFLSRVHVYLRRYSNFFHQFFRDIFDSFTKALSRLYWHSIIFVYGLPSCGK